MMAPKIDNADLDAKLELRRHFLRKYHRAGPVDVLDCCEGDGLIWERLRREFGVTSYWGVDLKAKPGRLQVNSIRILGQRGWPQKVVDVDTYGSPWKHWEALLGRISRPTTVFLTIGQWQMGTDAKILEAVGLGGLKVPLGVARRIHDFALSYCLTRAYDYAKTIVEIVEAVSTIARRARYVGVRIDPG